MNLVPGLGIEPRTRVISVKAIQLLKIAANRFFSVFLSGQCTTLAAAGEAQDIFRQPMCSVDIRLATVHQHSA